MQHHAKFYISRHYFNLETKSKFAFAVNGKVILDASIRWQFSLKMFSQSSDYAPQIARADFS